MRREKHILYFITYGLLALSAGIALPREVETISSLMGFFLAQLIFACGVLVHEIVFRRKWEDNMRTRVKVLKMNYDSLRYELSALRQETLKILNALNMKTQRRSESSYRDDDDERIYNKKSVDFEYETQSQNIEYEEEEEEELISPALVNLHKKRGNRIDFEYDNIFTQSKSVQFSQDHLLAEIRDALRHKRIGVKLQPIVNWPEGNIRMFECFSQVVTGAGKVISPGEYYKVAQRANLLNGFDSVVFLGSMEVVQRLMSSGSSFPVFYNISAATMQSDLTIQRFTRYAKENAALVKNLIIEFSIDDFYSFHETSKDNIMKLRDCGISFSIDNITSLDIDIAYLGSMNVKFLKLPASRVLKQMQRNQANVGEHIVNMKNITKQRGISLILEKVESKKQMLQASSINPSFAQGYLFGRPMTIDQAVEKARVYHSLSA